MIELERRAQLGSDASLQQRQVAESEPWTQALLRPVCLGLAPLSFTKCVVCCHRRMLPGSVRRKQSAARCVQVICQRCQRLLSHRRRPSKGRQLNKSRCVVDVPADDSVLARTQCLEGENSR